MRREHVNGVYYELALFGTTDRDKYEREILEARRRAEQLLWEKQPQRPLCSRQKWSLIWPMKNPCSGLFAEQMVAIASHDLKNPSPPSRWRQTCWPEANVHPEIQNYLATSVNPPSALNV